MAWSVPRTWSVGEVLTATNMNTYVSNDLAYLHGDTGPIDVAALSAYSLTNGGLTGATAASRWVGATVAGSPGSGTFSTGDWIVTQDGHVFICTAGGSPGTWSDAGTPGSAVTSVFGRTGAIVATIGDYTAAQVTNSIDTTASAVQVLAAGFQSTNPTQGIGYTTGAGNGVSQTGSRTNGVTINFICGQITTYNSALSSGSYYTFTVTDSTVAATDCVVLTANTLDGVNTRYWVSSVNAGSFTVTYLSSTTSSTALVFDFAVIKAVAS